MISGIYSIRNKVNGKFYIGSSNNIRIRFNTHRFKLRHNIHINSHLQNAFNKYGENAFSFDTLIECPVEFLYEYEQLFIDHLKPEYNISKCTVAPTRGVKQSFSHRAKINNTREIRGINKNTSKRMMMNSYAVGSKRSKEQIDLLLKSRYEKVRKPVNQLDKEGNVIKTFYSIKDAAQYMNVCNQAIHKSCNIRGSTCKGFNWQYAEIES